MSDIDELERRLAGALDRLARGFDRLDQRAPAAPPETADDDEAADLRRLLDEERLANQQLEERVRAIHETQQKKVSALEGRVADQRGSLADLDAELQRLRKSHEMLRTANEDMRRALEENVGEPHLINKAMLAELESVRAMRSAEEAEQRAVLRALEPLLAEAAGANTDTEETA